MNNQLEKLEKILELADQDYTTAEEVKEVFESVLAFVMKTREEIEQNMAQNKGEMESVENALSTELNKVEGELKKLIDKNKDLTMGDIFQVKTQLLDEINAIRDLIPEKADFTEVEARIAEVEAKILEIPEIPNMQPVIERVNEIEEDIAEIKKGIEELKKRPVGGGGGGTSAMAVARAFKYIFHTEEPTGAINGVNTTYTVKNNIWAILGFTLNGEQIAELPNYTFINRTITFTSALPAAYSGKDFEIKYIGT